MSLKDDPKVIVATPLENFEVGAVYDGLIRSYEENVVVLGKPVADLIEVEKRNPVSTPQSDLFVTDVNRETKTVTLGRKS